MARRVKRPGPRSQLTRSDLQRTGQLFENLMAREARPLKRLQWLAQPEHNILRIGNRLFLESIQHAAECFEDEVSYSGAFIRHLRYFIEGPDLPSAAIEEFCAYVDSCGQWTSDDLVDLWPLVRGARRRYQLERKDAAEQYYKLAWECGLDAMDSRSVRDTLMKMSK